MSDGKKAQHVEWTAQPMGGYEKRGWVEVFAGRSPVIWADAFTRTSYDETETHSGVRITAEALPLVLAAPNLLAELKATYARTARHHVAWCGCEQHCLPEARIRDLIARAEGKS